MYWNKMRARLTGDVSVREKSPPPLSSRPVEPKASRSSTGATDVPVRVLQEKPLSPWAGQRHLSVCLVAPPCPTRPDHFLSSPTNDV